MPAAIRIGFNADSSFAQCGNSSHGWGMLKVRSRPCLSIRKAEIQNKKTPSDEVRRKAGDSQEGIISKPGVFYLSLI
jgi:hypothetical protein